MRDKSHYNISDSFEVEIFCSDNGKCPLKKYIDKQTNHKKAVIKRYLKLLEKYGNELCMPYSKKIDKYIYELRIENYGYNIRILYFFLENRRIVVTSAFDKKTNKTPPKYIEIANIYRESWLIRRKK